MELTINLQKKIFDPAPSNLEALMHFEFPEKSKGIAVAVNNQVIPKDQWSATRLSNADNILIITATQGG